MQHLLLQPPPQPLDRARPGAASGQWHQWMALAVLESESGFRHLHGYDDLPRLKAALKEAIPDDE